MASDSETSFCSSENEASDEESGEEMVFENHVEPYTDEPLASDGDDEFDNDEADVDGLTATVLESRYEREVAVGEWCKCQRCSDETLVGALEFRCCHEVASAMGKLVFDGSLEKVKCITQHEDYAALTNRTVLLHVGPLLREKDGSYYRRRAGVSENEFIRAVAYRWITRWLCGCMGWDNTRPLPACVYNDIRSRFHSYHGHGYSTAQERQ